MEPVSENSAVILRTNSAWAAVETDLTLGYVMLVCR
jgi:hypothetical protein